MRELILLVFVTAGLFFSATELNGAGDKVVLNLASACTSAPCRRAEVAAGATSPWAPALEPITIFLAGTGLMGLGWTAWRRRLYSGARPIAGQTIIQDQVLHSSGS